MLFFGENEKGFMFLVLIFVSTDLIGISRVY